MGILPPRRPKLTRAECLGILDARRITVPAVVGFRGYYQDGMGVPGANDRGIYDDAIVVIGPAGVFKTYNANTDPSVSRKGVAVLRPGTYLYKKGVHGLSKPKPLRYAALVQASEVTVVRDLIGDDTGWFGINIHRGSLTSTSSLGCQTIYPLQWAEFKATVYAVLDRSRLTKIPYVLVTEADRRIIAKAGKL